jgi:phospholipase A1
LDWLGQCQHPANVTVTRPHRGDPYGLQNQRDAHPALGAHQNCPRPADPWQRAAAGFDLVWQLFSGDLSRPFRTTDHEPEITYIYPTDAQLPGGWRLRYSGISLIHQCNGQPLPRSRSWNRTALMAGMEKDKAYRLQARLWKRLKEDGTADDNPDISDKVGRAEVAAYWNVNADNTVGSVWRHSLSAGDGGSLRVEWFKSLGETSTASGRNGLRLHTQLFSGYGDSLIDYNRRRTVISVGLSLVDW